PGGRRPLARGLAALRFGLLRAVADLVLVELEAGSAERVGLDDVATGVEVALVDARDDIGVGVVPQLGTGAVEQTRREQHGAVPAVEDEALPRPHALHALPGR